MRIFPTNDSVDIYQYSNVQMKHLPEKSVKKPLKTMLYSNKPVYLTKDVDRDRIMTIATIEELIEI